MDVRRRFQVRRVTHSDASSESNLLGQELREIHTMWLEQKEKEEHGSATGTGGRKGEEEEDAVAEVPAEIETPVAFALKGLPTTTIDIDTPSSILQGIPPPCMLHDTGFSSETFVSIPATALSSPTLSISTVSDLTSTEFGEEIEGRTAARHDTLYFEDGNVEIVCGGTVFRVHSSILSFSSSKLRDMLSPSTLLNAPKPEGCPRVVFTDSADDFSVLLRMIYTPGCVPLPFDAVFVEPVDGWTDSRQGIKFQNLKHLHRSFG